MAGLDKRVATYHEALEGLTNEMTILAGGFGLCGIGRPYIMEQAITGDFALVKGWKADWYGNVIYRHTAQNFNPLMAAAGKITVVEVEEIVPPGELDPAAIHTPGIFVNRVIQGQFEKRIEQRTLSRKGA